MTEKVIIAGSGGQGIELSGELLAEAVMQQGRNVTFFPSYGAQVRGGHAYCHVVISDSEICSQVVEKPDTLIALNQQAYDKYADTVSKDGLLIANSSMVTPREALSARVRLIPATEEALLMGNVLVANMIVMGAFHASRPLLSREAFLDALKLHLTGKKAALIGIDTQAFDLGAKLAREAN